MSSPSGSGDGPPPESENDPEDLHEQRRMLKVRDNVQAWYETGAVNLFMTALFAGAGLYAWSSGVPFEAIAIVFLAHISADTGALWRVYVR